MKCGIHQDREAIGTCTECGIAFCEDCKVVIREKNVCKKCVDKVVNKPSQRNLVVAVLLSIFLPGSGQLYNGQIAKAFLILFTSWLVIPWLFGIYDAYSTAKEINEGKIVYKGATGCLIALILGMFLIIPGCALLAAIAIPNLLRAKISANDALAKATLRAVSTASEAYASVNRGHYPSSCNDLLNANPAYLNKNYCYQIISGYSFNCEFSDSGYKVSATPVTVGTSGTTTYTISTGGVLQP